MSDEHKIWITGRKIRKVVIEAKEVELEGDSGSTTRAFTPPNDLDDGPVTIKITLSDNTEVVRTHEYRKEGTNLIQLKDRQIEIKVTGRAIDIASVTIKNKTIVPRTDQDSTWTVTLPDDLDDGPWQVVISPQYLGETWKFDYEYRDKEEAQNQIIIVRETEDIEWLARHAVGAAKPAARKGP